MLCNCLFGRGPLYRLLADFATKRTDMKLHRKIKSVDGWGIGEKKAPGRPSSVPPSVPPATLPLRFSGLHAAVQMETEQTNRDAPYQREVPGGTRVNESLR